jgi:hypothetical protein
MNVTRTVRALSVRSNCNFFSSAATVPNPIISNSPHFKSVRLLNLSSPSRRPRPVTASLSSDKEDDVLLVADAGAMPGPVYGCKWEGRSIRFLNASEYLGGNLSQDGAILSHSFDPARPCPCDRCAQLAAVFTRSGLYIRTLRLTLTTRTVRAPLRACGRSCLAEWCKAGRVEG